MKVLTTIKSDPEIEKICRDIEKVDEHIKERVKFIEKQFESEMKANKEKQEPLWGKLVDRMKELGLVDKKFSHKKESLSFSFEKNAVMHHDKNAESGTPAIISALLVDKDWI